MPKHDVLISYSKEDHALAESVLRALTTRGIRCWAAFQDLEAGQYWPGAITEAISDCAIFLLLLTKNSNASRQVVRELTQADTLNKTLYCIQTEHLSISPNVQYFFSAVQRYEAFQVDLDTSLARMADDIARQLQRLDHVERPITQTAAPASVSIRRDGARVRTIGISSAVAVGVVVLGIAVVMLVNRMSRGHAGDAPSSAAAPSQAGRAADPPPVGGGASSKVPDAPPTGMTTGGSKTAEPPLAGSAAGAAKAANLSTGGRSAGGSDVTKAVPRARRVDVADFMLSISRENFYSSKEFEIADLDPEKDFIIGFDIKSTRSGGSTRYGIAWNFQPDDFFLFTIHSTNFGYYTIGPGRSRAYTPFARLSQGNVDINAERGFDQLQMERRGDDLLFRINRQEVWRTSSYKLRSNRFAFWAADFSDAVMRSYTVQQ